MNCSISCHALIRFLERGLDMDLSPQRLAAIGRGVDSDFEVLKEVRYSHPGLVEEVERELIPHLAKGAKHGAVSTYYGGLTFHYRGTMVTTVVEGRPEPWLRKREDGSRLMHPKAVAA